MPHYLRYRILRKECENKIVEPETGEKHKCGKPFETTNPQRLYCDDCRATKTWGTPAIKRLAA